MKILVRASKRISKAILGTFEKIMFIKKLDNAFFNNIYFYFFLAIIIIFAILAFIAFFRLTYSRYLSMHLNWPEDLAIFNQAFWSFIHYRSLEITVRPYPHLLGMHFSPIFFLLVPFYLLYQSPPALFFISIATLCIAGVGIFLITYRITDSLLIALGLSIFYFTYLPLINLATLGFRFIILTVLFLTLALFFYFVHHFWGFMLCLLLVSFCREDVPLILLGFSILAWLDKRESHWRWVPGLFGLGYFVVVFSLIMPALNFSAVSGGAGFESYSYLGRNAREIIGTFVFNFPTIFSALTREHIFVFLLDLLRPLLFLPLLSPLWFMIPFSQFFIIFLSSYTYYANIFYWYFAPVLPFVFISSAFAIKKVSRRLIKWEINFNFIKFAIGIGFLVYSFSGPGFDKILEGINLKYYSRINEFEVFFKKIPKDASLTLQTNFSPYFSSRRHLYLPNMFFKMDSEYILLDFKADSFPLSREHFYISVEKMIISGKYGVVEERNGLILFRRGYSTAGNKEVFRKFKNVKAK